MTNITSIQQRSVSCTDAWASCMRRGDWEAAWLISDRICRLHRDLEPRDEATGRWLPRHVQRVWDGTPLNGKRVLVRCYHGLGDTIQFIRFVPVLKRSTAHVTVLGQTQLLPLLATVDGIDALLELDDGECQAAYDVDIEVMELPHALRITPATVPRSVPYIQIRADGPSREHRRDRRPRVGLVWQSGSWDPCRSVPCELMEQLTGLHDVRFMILQRGPALASWRGAGGEIPAIRDILAEAALLRSLDLLVCVDTLSAHLAGALGVRTWTLLPAQADWRWMEDREDTPWYPTMRLFRQPRAGDWESVIARVARELAELASQ